MALSASSLSSTKLCIAWDSELPVNTFVVTDLAASKNPCAAMLNYRSSNMTYNTLLHKAATARSLWNLWSSAHCHPILTMTLWLWRSQKKRVAHLPQQMASK